MIRRKTGQSVLRGGESVMAGSREEKRSDETERRE